MPQKLWFFFRISYVVALPGGAPNGRASEFTSFLLGITVVSRRRGILVGDRVPVSLPCIFRRNIIPVSFSIRGVVKNQRRGH